MKCSHPTRAHPQRLKVLMKDASCLAIHTFVQAHHTWHQLDMPRPTAKELNVDCSTRFARRSNTSANALAQQAANSVEILPSRACPIQTLDAMVSQGRRRIIEAEVADSLRDQRLRTPRTPAHRKRSGKERVSCLWCCTFLAMYSKKKKRRKRDIYRCANCRRCGTTLSVLRVEVVDSENMCHLATL